MPDKQHLLDFSPKYICKECGRERRIDEIKLFIFADGEIRRQCVFCSFHPEEELVGEKDIDDFDFDN